MSQNLFHVFPTPVALALLALVLILLPVARVLMALRKPAPVRVPVTKSCAPSQAEADLRPRQGQFQSVARAPREAHS